MEKCLTNSLCANILSELIASSLLGAIGLLLLLIAIFFLIISPGRKLHRFFGTNRGKPLLIYLSTHPIENKIFKHRSEIENEAITQLISTKELDLVPLFTGLFSLQLPVKIADTLAGLVGSFWFAGHPDVQFKPSPLDEDDLAFSSTICIGSHKYNTATEYYFSKHVPYMVIKGDPPDNRENLHVMINLGRQMGKRIERSLKDGEEWSLGIIVKLSGKGETALNRGGLTPPFYQL